MIGLQVSILANRNQFAHQLLQVLLGGLTLADCVRWPRHVTVHPAGCGSGFLSARAAARHLGRVRADVVARQPLAALSQAGLVKKLVDALVWVVLPVHLLAKGVPLPQIGWIAGTSGLVWGLAQQNTISVARSHARTISAAFCCIFTCASLRVPAL